MQSRNHLGHYLPGPSFPPLKYVPYGERYPLPSEREKARDIAFRSTGSLPSIARVSHHMRPRRAFSRYDVYGDQTLQPPRSRAPYRCAHPSGVTIEQGHRLTSMPDAPALRKSSSHTVLYTHDSPFIQPMPVAKKMTPADFDKLSEKTGYTPNELLRYYKTFVKLLVGKGVDIDGLAIFLGRYGNVDPTDDFVCRRMFELINRRRQPTVTFDQVVGLLTILKPPGAAVVDDSPHAPQTIAKVDLFFNIIDTNCSGAICVREIQDFTAIKNSEKLDVAKERRKMMVEKVTKQIYDHLGKTRHASVTREELVHAVGSNHEIGRFFAKGLFLACSGM